MLDWLVVGGGIFGSVIGAALEKIAGQSVTIVDDARPLAGSPPAACLMKPSWFGGMKDEAGAALALLTRLHGLQTLSFRVQPTGIEAPIYWVEPSRVLGWTGANPRVRGRVRNLIRLRGGGRSWLAELDGGGSLEARSVVLATGVWASELRPVPGLEARLGAAFLWEGAESRGACIWPGVPNPYRQVVVFDRGDGVWAGDGTAVKNLTDSVLANSKSRCARLAGLREKQALVLTGARPYIKGLTTPCYLAQQEPRLWVATGGAKNGTIAAAWAAHRILNDGGA